MQIADFFAKLWQGYLQITPQAKRIHEAVLARNQRIINDHVAFRTFQHPAIGLQQLEPHLIALGYQRFAPYEFPDKHLFAYGYLHADPSQPKVFLSELLVSELSDHNQQIINRFCDQISPQAVSQPEVFWAGRLWATPSWQEYQQLAQESDYAAWLAVMGIRANHFTINVNELDQDTELSSVNQLVESLGLAINKAGGAIKGSPQVLLEQSSTEADRQTLVFAGGDEHEIPTCYYEFAKRYPDQNGQLFQGFVAQSASNIFTSTNRKATTNQKAAADQNEPSSGPGS